MSDAFYTVVIYDLVHDRIDYEYRHIYNSINDARSFANGHGGDDQFVALVARYDINDLSVLYV